MSPRLLFSSFAFLLAVAAPARADQLVFSATSALIASGGTGTVLVPMFDPSLGVLRNVHVSVQCRMTGTWGMENTSAFVNLVGYSQGQSLGAGVPTAFPGVGFPLTSTSVFQPGSVYLLAFDGSIDYGGTSGTTFAFSDLSQSPQPDPYLDIDSESSLQLYAGVGSFSVGLGPVAASAISNLPFIQQSAAVSAGARIDVTYTYDPFPARICRSTASAGCPCNNLGSAGNGCANSGNSAGGALDATGTASISADTLVLHGASMTSSNALYFQGTAFGYVPAVYGDGLRCVTGSVVRLGTKTNVSGSSQYPSSGDVPIALRGNVTSTGLSYYQVVYRDGGNFCSASQFNATNGLAILWTP
jgi:hypothetical protein